MLYNDSEHPISGFYVGRYKERRLIPSLLNTPVPFQKMRDGEVEQTRIAMLLLTPKNELVGFDGRENDMRLRIRDADDHYAGERADERDES